MGSQWIFIPEPVFVLCLALFFHLLFGLCGGGDAVRLVDAHKCLQLLHVGLLLLIHLQGGWAGVREGGGGGGGGERGGGGGDVGGGGGGGGGGGELLRCGG